MLKCEDCGLIFEDEDLAEWYEDMGEFWGQPVREKMSGCPRCFSGAVDYYYGKDEEGEDDE